MIHEDEVMAEVRRNREALLADFDGDTHKMNEYYIAQQAADEAAGVRYETEEERQARFTCQRQQREAEERREASA